MGSGIIDIAQAETKEQVRAGGANIGLGGIMVKGARHSIKETFKGLEFKSFRQKLLDTTSPDELKEVQEIIKESDFSKQQQQVLEMDCIKQLGKIEEYRKANAGVNEGVKDNPTPKSKISTDLSKNDTQSFFSAESQGEGFLLVIRF